MLDVDEHRDSEELKQKPHEALVTMLTLANLHEGTQSIQVLMTAHSQPYEAILVDLRWNEQSELQTLFDHNELASPDDIPSSILETDITPCLSSMYCPPQSDDTTLPNVIF